MTGTTPADLMLWPGVAIDGYGREILVLDRVPLAVDDFEKCWSVLLYYCDTPSRIRRGGRARTTRPRGCASAT